MPIDKTRIKYFTIKWTALVSLLDGLDADDNPDTDFITGIITLRPSKKNLILQYRDATDPFTVVPMQRRVNIDSGSFSDQGRTYLKLEAASSDAVPTQWFWEAIFDLNYKGTPIVIPNIQFMGIPDTVVDFTNELPVFDAVSQVEYARGPQGNSVQRIEIAGAGNDTLVFYSTALGNPEISRITIPQLTTANEAASVAVVASELANQYKAAADAFSNAADAHRVAAAASAAESLAYRNTASGHATTASTQAGIATTKAAEADASAVAAGQAVIGQIPDGSLGTIKFQNTVVTSLGKADTSSQPGHSHTASDISNSSVVGRNVLVAADQADARSAIGAGTSSLIIGTAAGTAAAGDDSRLSNTRTPSANSVDSSKIVDGSISTVDIADLAITLAKLASGSVDSSKIVNGSIATIDIADLAITLGKLASNSVDSSKIVDGSIVDADINAAAAIAMSKLGVGKVLGSNNGTATTLTIWVGTEAQYTAIGTKDANTLYFRTA